MADLAQLASWLLGFSLLFGLALWLVALVKWIAGGDPRPALLWGTVFLVVGAGGYGVIYWFLGGGAPPGVKAGFVVVPADYYSQKGIPFEASRYFPVEVTVVPIIPVYDYYSITVDWGDGSSSSWPPPAGEKSGEESEWHPGEPATLRHAYHDLGLYTVRVSIAYFRVVGERFYESTIERSFTVNVTAPWYEYAGAVKSFVSGLEEEGNVIEKAIIKAVKTVTPSLADAFAAIVDMMAGWMASLGINAGYAYYYYVAMPTSANFPALREVYESVQVWALYLLPPAFVASLLWRGFWEWERGGDALLDAFRDLLAVSIGVYVALDAYDLLAGIVNTIALSVAQLGQLGALYSMVVAAAAVLSVVGMFAPGPGALAAGVFMLLLAMVVVGALKWLLAAAIVAALPVLLVLWLVPGLRSAVSAALHVLAGLFVFTIVAAVLSALVGRMALTLTETQEGRSLLFALVVPIVFAAATPMIANQVAGSLGFAPTAALALLRGGGSLQPPALQAAPAAAAGAAGSGLVLMAGGRPVSGTVLGRAPAPLAAYAPAAVAPAVRPPQAPAAAPAAPAAAAPARIPAGVREKAARALGRLADYARREAHAFEHELARRIGVTPARAAARVAGLGYTVSRAAAPLVKAGAARVKGWVSSLLGSRAGWTARGGGGYRRP